MIAQIMLPMIAIFVLLGSIANCGGKKKGAAGAGAGVAANSPKKADGPSKKETKKEGDDGNYEELAVPQ
ncbi:uncharacterized protein CELE_F36H12.4 [Caenorhabditis elegans]|uniref:Uncharacterized protein n=1 Tax=Caenorhabditis elegans TaxID=6239 RepID=O76717_CAEEL|nr:Uncharacterized protein CELE_F36H12.4 [Caenorhabditis elegans]CCD70662.1 Uncharacterized protein CELE_F36H12.4 [Caenorhabditis elegans]|eukprot:NP_500765.2 Uncharacterized protein CELE_F36H12.4 [Caenorhabditis elegans]